MHTVDDMWNNTVRGKAVKYVILIYYHFISDRYVHVYVIM